jgi:hypothetical protein
MLYIIFWDSCTSKLMNNNSQLTTITTIAMCVCIYIYIIFVITLLEGAMGHVIAKIIQIQES